MIWSITIDHCVEQCGIVLFLSKTTKFSIIVAICLNRLVTVYVNCIPEFYYLLDICLYFFRIYSNSY